MAMEKFFFFFFHHWKKYNFFLVSSVKFLKFKKKIVIFYLHIINSSKMKIGYTFHFGYTYRADCI